MDVAVRPGPGEALDRSDSADQQTARAQPRPKHVKTTLVSAVDFGKFIALPFQCKDLLRLILVHDPNEIRLPEKTAATRN